MVKSIMQTDRKCYLCGAEGVSLQRHHACGGSGRRRLSDEDGLTVYLCLECHNRVHNDRAYDLIVKRDAQKAWEAHYGSREDFIQRYSKSWLED